MKLQSLHSNYMLDIDDARVAKENNKRCTMRVGRLEQRLENVEYYTALNLLNQKHSLLKF